MNEYFYKLKKIYLFFILLIFVFYVRLLIIIIKLPYLLKMLTPKKINKSPNIETIIKYVNIIVNSRKLNFENKCLIRSLILFYFLMKEGECVKIVFGIRKKDDSIEGHSWLVIGDKSYLDEPNPEKIYTIMHSYP